MFARLCAMMKSRLGITDPFWVMGLENIITCKLDTIIFSHFAAKCNKILWLCQGIWSPKRDLLPKNFVRDWLPKRDLLIQDGLCIWHSIAQTYSLGRLTLCSIAFVNLLNTYYSANILTMKEN